MASVAIIGAGLAGLVTARSLSGCHEVTVFEKGRGVGGRMATRYAGKYEFDHGAQFFTARSEEFRAFLKPMVERGVIAPWDARFAELRRSGIGEIRRWNADYPHYVGVPRMNAMCKWLARGLDVRLETTITSLTRKNGCWRLATDVTALPDAFDWVAITAPAAQTTALLPVDSPIRETTAAYTMQACFALMLGFAKSQAVPWQATRVRDADISWISLNHSKPGRPIGYSLLVHSTNAWADAHLDDDPEEIRAHLVQEAAAVTGTHAGEAESIELHRWRYANIGRQAGERYAIDRQNQLAAAGDWFVRGRVEGAFLSARALSAKLDSLL
jgi:predicted NAD/FAD-dependent oxidoreductase